MNIKELAQKTLDAHNVLIENEAISGSAVDWVDFTNTPNLPEEAGVLFFHTKKHRRDRDDNTTTRFIAVSELEQIAE